MKKIVLNMSDMAYEKLRIEALFEKKDIPSIILNRIFHKPFEKEVEESFDNWFNQEFEKITQE